jgi:hypothetical protein
MYYLNVGVLYGLTNHIGSGAEPLTPRNPKP